MLIVTVAGTMVPLNGITWPNSACGQFHRYILNSSLHSLHSPCEWGVERKKKLETSCSGILQVFTCKNNHSWYTCHEIQEQDIFLVCGTGIKVISVCCLWRIKCDVADVQCCLHIKRKLQSTFYKQKHHQISPKFQTPLNIPCCGMVT